MQRNVVRTLDVRADGVVAARLGLEESTPLVHLERLRLSDEEPLAIDRVWMPERLAAPLLEVDFARTALYDEYAARCGIRVTGGHEHLRAVVPDEAERELLGTGPDVAAFAIDRLGLAGGQAGGVAAHAGARRPLQRDGDGSRPREGYRIGPSGPGSGSQMDAPQGGGCRQKLTAAMTTQRGAAWPRNQGRRK